MSTTPRSSVRGVREHAHVSIAERLPTAAIQHPTSGVYFDSCVGTQESEFLAYPAQISLPDGSKGEIQLKSPIIFRRYHNKHEATRAAFTPDGWFPTGDLGRVIAVTALQAALREELDITMETLRHPSNQARLRPAVH